MRLTKLELHGFKSFADATQIVFDEGVTAIVGPNGCGKSNVSDAVRWVLGEQRARLLRGAKMEEVIFQGSSARRPVNIAEVSLHFDNSDGDLSVPMSEVVIARRLSRSGESEYLLNNTPCRLRDIHDLMRGTGLGADAGVVIEARMIDALLSDRPDERRELFEEAAGVGLYRDRRRTTERRLEETSHDLQRLDDLLIEKTTLVRSLARQRKRAERHAELMRRRLALELTLAEYDMAEWAERLRGSTCSWRSCGRARPRRTRSWRGGAPARRGACRAREGPTPNASSSAGSWRSSATRSRSRARDRRGRRGTTQCDRTPTPRGGRAARRAVAGENADRKSSPPSQRDRATADAAVAAAESALVERSAAEDLTRNRLAAARARRSSNVRADRPRQAARHCIASSSTARARSANSRTSRRASSSCRTRFRRSTSSSRRRTRRPAPRSRRPAARARPRPRPTRRSAPRATRRRRHATPRPVARTALRDADDTLTALRGKANALEQLERERVGLAPAAARLLRERARFGEGAIVGPISDFVGAGTDAALLVERFLGATLHAVVVRDRDVAEASSRVARRDTARARSCCCPSTRSPAGDAPAVASDDLAARVQADRRGGPLGADAARAGALAGRGHGVSRRTRRGVAARATPAGAGPLRRRAELTETQGQRHARRTVPLSGRDGGRCSGRRAVSPPTPRCATRTPTSSRPPGNGTTPRHTSPRHSRWRSARNARSRNSMRSETALNGVAIALAARQGEVEQESGDGRRAARATRRTPRGGPGRRCRGPCARSMTRARRAPARPWRMRRRRHNVRS